MPLIRRLPKRGFNNAQFKLKIAVVNLDDLETLAAKGTVTEALLRESGLVRGNIDGVKILGRGTLTRPVAVEVDHVSASARERIEAVGGSVVLREKSKPAPAES